ncbi:MAG TPA: dihydroneopterin aldolase [Candidatus Saccharimonadales bacterium]|nr:dihydroneopterin aldolase [Candidatus Saccharimonadales bacterium]
MKQLAKIYIKDLSIDCFLGVGGKERNKKQTVLISVDIQFDAAMAIKTDAVADTVDYSGLSKKISRAISASQFHLFEALASFVLDICLEDQRVVQAAVEISKPQRKASVVMMRERTNL